MPDPDPEPPQLQRFRELKWSPNMKNHSKTYNPRIPPLTRRLARSKHVSRKHGPNCQLLGLRTYPNVNRRSSSWARVRKKSNSATRDKRSTMRIGYGCFTVGYVTASARSWWSGLKRHQHQPPRRRGILSFEKRKYPLHQSHRHLPSPNHPLLLKPRQLLQSLIQR